MTKQVEDFAKYTQAVLKFQETGKEEDFNEVYYLMESRINSLPKQYAKKYSHFMHSINDYTSVVMEALVTAVKSFEYSGRDNFVGFFNGVAFNKIHDQLIRTQYKGKKKDNEGNPEMSEYHMALVNSLDKPMDAEEEADSRVDLITSTDTLEDQYEQDQAGERFKKIDELVVGFVKESSEQDGLIVRELFRYTLENPDAMDKEVNKHLENVLDKKPATVRSNKKRSLEKFAHYCISNGHTPEMMQQK